LIEVHGPRDVGPAVDALPIAPGGRRQAAGIGSKVGVHRRADIPRTVDLYQSLIGLVGEDQANTICNIANGAGASVNSLVLGYFVRRANEADGHDPRLVRGAYGILLRDLLAFDARDACYQPFARCVDAAVFGLAGVYQWGVEGPT
jgi:hypothetical protein